jgi:hypothetical protein
MLRRREAELLAQVRQALGAGRFDDVFAAGSRLNQREAVATVRDQRGADTACSLVEDGSAPGQGRPHPFH